MAPVLKPFQLLEINIISAQDLEPVAKKMRTYAKAWVHPNRKLCSCMDTQGNNNPTWNDKFVFRVDDAFLRADTSAVMIEIYTTNWFRHILVGTVRVLVGNLIPPPGGGRQHHLGMRFVALQVRRPSGRPQGILNIGVALLDGSMRSMPLYKDGQSAVGYHDLMQEFSNILQQQKENKNDDNQGAINVKPILCRSRSERSERVGLDDYSPNSSMVAVPTGKVEAKDTSILSISDFMDPFIGIKKKGKASSVINGSELREKPKLKGKRSKASSVVSGSVYSKASSFLKKNGPNLKNKGTDKDENAKNGDRNPGTDKDEKSKNGDQKLGTETDENTKNGDQKPGPDKDENTKNSDQKPGTDKDENTNNAVQKPGTDKDETSKNGDQKPGPDEEPNQTPKIKKTSPKPKFVNGGRFKANSILSESEIGPSPSEVAAIMAARKYPLDDYESSVLDGWSMDDSVEGIKSKLERWRTELPPLYGHHGYSSAGSHRSSVLTRRHKDSGNGLFSCFGNICGYECQCVCGKPHGRRSHGSRFGSSSVGSPDRSTFL